MRRWVRQTTGIRLGGRGEERGVEGRVNAERSQAQPRALQPHVGPEEKGGAGQGMAWQEVH